MEHPPNESFSPGLAKFPQKGTNGTVIFAAKSGFRLGTMKSLSLSWIGLIQAFVMLSSQSANAGPEAKDSISQPKPQSSRSIQWNFRVGAAYRHLGDIDFNSGAYSSPGLLPSLQPVLGAGRASGIDGLGVGSTDTFADRVYVDGFVFVDGATADPTSFLPGTTAYWGYQSDNQVRNGSLYYSGGEYSTSSSQSSNSSTPSDWSSGIGGASPVLELEGLLPIDDHWSVGGAVAFLFISADSSHSATSFRALRSLSESSFAVNDRYDLQGVIPPLAPYAGTLISPGTAPLIDNIPTERIITQSGDSVQSANFFNEVSESIKIHLYTLSLGPTLHYDTDKFDFSGGLGLAVNVADWNSSFDEKLNQTSGGSTTELRKWRDRSGKNEVLPGFYLQGSAGYQLTEAWQLSVFGRYDWSESLEGNVGPSSFSAELSGYTLGGSVTFTF